MITPTQIAAASRAVKATPRGIPTAGTIERAKRIHNRLARMISDEGIDVSLGLMDYFIAERMIDFMVTLAQPSPISADEPSIRRFEDGAATGDEEQLLSTTELQRQLQISGPSLSLFVARGMPRWKFGKKNYFRLSEIKRWGQAQRAAGRQKFRVKKLQELVDS